MKNPLIAIVGPTAVGKTGLAIELAKRIDAEAVGADSRQIYRYMDIGTAKPTLEEQQAIRHHLIDFLDPDQDFNLSFYKQLAMDAISDIHSRGKMPLLVGGSGLYVWAVLEGWTVPEVPPDIELREQLRQRAESEGAEVLFEELGNLDPEAAEVIDSRNVRRVIRALEVCLSTGKPFSEFQQKNPPDFDIRIIGLTAGREELYYRIDSRVDRMIAEGFVNEVKGLFDKGYSLELPAMSSLGYREIGAYLNSEMTMDEAADKIKFQTHRFARQQYAWFKPKDSRIDWFDLSSQNISHVAELAAGKLRHT